jgi:hypothetical protein
MRRSTAAFGMAIASLCLFGTVAASPAGAVAPGPSAVSVAEATTAARFAVVGVPAPRPSSTPSVTTFGVLVAAAALGALVLGYLARQRRRSVAVPVLAWVRPVRGPPRAAAPRSPAP